MVFERFTDRARRAVVLAKEEAAALNHNYIGTEHLLLGLILEEEGVAAAALTQLGVTSTSSREKIKEIIGVGHQPPQGHIPFTPNAKKTVELAIATADEMGHPWVATEHVLLGIIRVGETVAAMVLQGHGHLQPLEVRQKILTMLTAIQDSAPGPVPEPVAHGVPAGLADAFRTSPRPVHGRRQEIQRVAQTLARHSRNNPVVIGEPGIGRRSVVSGLGQAITDGEVAIALRGKWICELDPSRLDDREGIGKALVAVCNQRQAVLCLDVAELSGRNHLAQELRDAVISGQLQVVGIATPESFASLDATLLQSLQPIRIAEMSVETAAEVLRDVRERMQEHHRLEITDDALIAVARAARTRITTSPLPGSAVDLLDEICARNQPVDATVAVAVTESTVAEVVRELTVELYFQHGEPSARTPSTVSNPFADSGVDLWMIS